MMRLDKKLIFALTLANGCMPSSANELFDCKSVVLVRKGEVQEAVRIEEFQLSIQKLDEHKILILGDTTISSMLDVKPHLSNKLSHQIHFHEGKWDIVYSRKLSEHTESIHLNFDETSGKLMFRSIKPNDVSISANGKCIRQYKPYKPN